MIRLGIVGWLSGIPNGVAQVKSLHALAGIGAWTIENHAELIDQFRLECS